MKKNLLLFLLFVVQFGMGYAQLQIPRVEADFINPANFPDVPGDAMEKSRTNYYRASGYDFMKKPDGSLYLTEGGWGSAQVDSNFNLIRFINRYNHPTNGSYFKSVTTKPWDITLPANQFEDGFFRLYSHLKLPSTNPTPNTTTSHLKQLRRATSNETFPYFNSYAPENGNLIYNWQTWLYPMRSGQAFVDPKTANNLRNMNYGGAVTYRDYNYATLRDADPSNDLADNATDQNYELPLSYDPNAPTGIYTRINNARDKMIITIWYGYKPLAGVASKPLADLRMSGWDDSYDLKYKLWFSSIAAVDPRPGNNEYLKIQAANLVAQGLNDANNGQGTDMIAFNKKFDDIADIAEDMLSGATEAAMEVNGKREVKYNYDKDAYGEISKTLQLKFRMLSVGMFFDEAKMTERIYNTTYSFIERIFSRVQEYKDFKDTIRLRKINMFHPNIPFGLTKERYIDIKTSRPAIAFGTVDAQAGNVYMGTPMTMLAGSSGVLTLVNLDITDATSQMLPFQEIEANPEYPTIDPDRVRVSLIRKAVYDTLASYNNDPEVVPGFAYLTQTNFVALQNTIPIGEYMIKYDYSSPDSKSFVKTEGDKLGEIFAKSIFRPLKVLGNSPVNLVGFEAENVPPNKNRIKWIVTNQKNIDRFVLEHSPNAVLFKEVTFVLSRGEGSNSYEYIHNLQPSESNFYRLKIIDRDGTIHYSKVIATKKYLSGSLQVSPNPAKDFIKVEGVIGGFSIYNNLGQLVYQGVANGTDVKVDLSRFVQGVYYLRANEEAIRFTVVK